MELDPEVGDHLDVRGELVRAKLQELVVFRIFRIRVARVVDRAQPSGGVPKPFLLAAGAEQLQQVAYLEEPARTAGTAGRA